MSEAPFQVAGMVLSLLGSLLFLAAAIGLLRLPDVYTRAHSPAKAATLGLLLSAAGSISRYGELDVALWLEKVVLILFVLLTVPVATQMLVRAAAACGIPHMPQTRGAPIATPVERLDE